MNKHTEEIENALNVLKRNPAKGAEIVVSLLQSKNDMVKLEAAIFILYRVRGIWLYVSAWP